MYRVWQNPNPRFFVPYASLSALCFFLFGFHVHEKAILMASVPLTLIALSSRALSRPAFLLNTIGTYALFPLLFQPGEIPFKLALFVTHTLVSYHIYGSDNTRHEIAYMLGLLPLFIFTEIAHPIWLAPRLPFLPLLLTSIYCAMGVLYGWLLLYRACWWQRPAALAEGPR